MSENEYIRNLRKRASRCLSNPIDAFYAFRELVYLHEKGKKKSLTNACIFDDDHICIADGYYIKNCKDCLEEMNHE